MSNKVYEPEKEWVTSDGVVTYDSKAKTFSVVHSYGKEKYNYPLSQLTEGINDPKSRAAIYKVLCSMFVTKFYNPLYDNPITGHEWGSRSILLDHFAATGEAFLPTFDETPEHEEKQDVE